MITVNSAYTGFPWLDPRSGLIGIGLEDRGGWQTVTEIPEFVEGMEWYGSLDENKTYLAICSNNKTSEGMGNQEIYQHVFTCKMKHHERYDIYFQCDTELVKVTSILSTSMRRVKQKLKPQGTCKRRKRKYCRRIRDA